ncbi:MAG: ABC-2 transporter permease [Clostridia bacterium]|nr:ABC-2 transporter permease [Clostridia bacterium]
MRNLLYKEFKLCMMPIVWAFMAFVLMLLIPNYLYLIPCFFICNAIFYVFQTGTVNNDLLYTVLLPVGKRDAVKARYLFVIIIQMIMLILYVVMIAIKNAVMPISNFGLDACPTLIGAALITFAVFNAVFLPEFYKTGVKAGRSFLLASIAIFVWITVCEGFFIAAASASDKAAAFGWVAANIDCMPKTAEAWTAQLIIIAVCAVIYAAVNMLSCKASCKNLEKVNL